MKNIAIVGAGPTGIYTFLSLLRADVPMTISIYEKAEEAGVGMPYNDDENSRMMLANIASIEIPPIASTYLDWLRRQDGKRLARYGVDKSGLHDRQFLPRILLGEHFRDQFLALVQTARNKGFQINVHEFCEVTDIEATPDGVLLRTEGDSTSKLFDLAVIATGHVWPASIRRDTRHNSAGRHKPANLTLSIRKPICPARSPSSPTAINRAGSTNCFIGIFPPRCERDIAYDS